MHPARPESHASSQLLVDSAISAVAILSLACISSALSDSRSGGTCAWYECNN